MENLLICGQLVLLCSSFSVDIHHSIQKIAISRWNFLLQVLSFSPLLLTPKEWDSISDPAKSLIQALLEIDPEKRITAEKALEHPWIKGEIASSRVIRGSIRTLKKNNTLRQEGKPMERPKSQNKAATSSVFDVFDTLPEIQEEEEKVPVEKKEAPRAPSKEETTSSPASTTALGIMEKLKKSREERQARRRERRGRGEASIPNGVEERLGKLEKELTHYKTLVGVLTREVEVLKQSMEEEEEYNAESRKKIKEELWKVMKERQEEKREKNLLSLKVADLEEKVNSLLGEKGKK